MVPAVATNDAVERWGDVDAAVGAVCADNANLVSAILAGDEGVVAPKAYGGDALAPFEAAVGPDCSNEDDKHACPGVVGAEDGDIEGCVEEGR